MRPPGDRSRQREDGGEPIRPPAIASLPSPSIDPVWTRRFTPTEQANLAEEARATNGAGAAALAGMRFAVKDLIAVRGCVRGCGNPHWAARQQASTVSAVDSVLALTILTPDCSEPTRASTAALS